MPYMNFDDKNKEMDYSLELGALYLAIVLSSFGLFYIGVRDYVNSRNNEQTTISNHIIKTNLEDKLK